MWSRAGWRCLSARRAVVKRNSTSADRTRWRSGSQSDRAAWSLDPNRFLPFKIRADKMRFSAMLLLSATPWRRHENISALSRRRHQVRTVSPDRKESPTPFVPSICLALLLYHFMTVSGRGDVTAVLSGNATCAVKSWIGRPWKSAQRALYTVALLERQTYQLREAIVAVIRNAAAETKIITLAAGRIR